MKIDKLSLAPYGGNCLLVTNCTHRQLIAWVYRKFKVKTEDDSPGQLLPLVRAGEPTTYIVYIAHWNWLIDEQTLAIHELYHLAARVLKDAHVNDEEATAYFLQHLVGEAWRALRSLHGGRR